MYNLITEYFPDIEELTTEQITAARAEVVSYLRPKFPNQDMSPGSVFGDIYVSPCALFLAALTVAQNRFMSDLNLENVSNGVIYSCNFVESYLGNFAVKDVGSTQSSGMVRLTFSADSTYSVNKGTKFQFGTSDIFYPRLASTASDTITILPSGSIPDVDMNEVALVQTALRTWAVDLPLVGKMTADVARGTAGLSGLVQPALIGIAAATSFNYGLPALSLSALAEMARRTFYAASVGSRNSTRSFIFQQWPETSIASVVTSGDVEMQRSSPASPLALAIPAVDVYYRSGLDLQLESQTVRVGYDATRRVFRGKVNFLHRPSLMVSVRPAANLELEMVSADLYCRISSNRFPGSTGCGTEFEEFWIEIVPPVNQSNVILVDRATDIYGEYAMFTITYRADPILNAVGRTLSSADNKPIGIDVATKAGPLVVLNNLDVGYRRKPGTVVLLDTARKEIAAYVNRVGWPELFSEAPISEIMYAAGALRTQTVTYDASLSLTPAKYRFDKTFNPSLNPDWAGHAVECYRASIDTQSGMRPHKVIVGEGEAFAITDRNIRYFVLPENIKFTEQQ